MSLGWFGVCVWGFSPCLSRGGVNAGGLLVRGVICCVGMDGERGWEVQRVGWEWAGSLVSFLQFGDFLGAVIALTNVNTEHPSRETLL